MVDGPRPARASLSHFLARHGFGLSPVMVLTMCQVRDASLSLPSGRICSAAHLGLLHRVAKAILKIL